jgi:predicted nucleic acid-binding protein
VTVVYFDSSAFVKLIVEEEGSDVVSMLWNGCDGATSSRLAHPEVCAALAAAHRNRTLDDSDFATARQVWGEFWETVRPVELTPGVEQRAGELADCRSLRGADAVHLASALTIDSPGLIVAVWDRRLHAGAAAERLAVVPRLLPT